MKLNKKDILILVLILISLFLFARDCGRTNKPYEKIDLKPIQIQPIESTSLPDIKQEFPYVKDGYLYTEKRTIAIKDIMRIDVDTTTVNYVMITWQKGNYSGGIFTMSMSDFRKIAKDLGVRNA